MLRSDSIFILMHLLWKKEYINCLFEFPLYFSLYNGFVAINILFFSRN